MGRAGVDVAAGLYLLIGFIAVILVVEVVNSLVGHALNNYGIVPRTSHGTGRRSLSARSSTAVTCTFSPTRWDSWRWAPWR